MPEGECLKRVILLFEGGIREEAVEEIKKSLIEDEEIGKKYKFIPGYGALLYESTIKRLEEKKYPGLKIEESKEYRALPRKKMDVLRCLFGRRKKE